MLASLKFISPSFAVHNFVLILFPIYMYIDLYTFIYMYIFKDIYI